MIKAAVFLGILLLFGGCDIDRQKAALMEQKQEPAQQDQPLKQPVQAETNQTRLLQLRQKGEIELEKLKAQNEQKLQAMRLESKEKELAIQEKLTQSEHNLTAATHEQNIGLYKTAIAVFGAVALIFALIWYFISKAKRKSEQRLQEEKMRHESHMKQQEFYQQRINKLLDIAASKDSDETVRKDAMKMLKNDSSFKTIEFKDD
ncbi:MAG: hypothetical protein ACQERK_03940 [Campylobacterota bacterium]